MPAPIHDTFSKLGRDTASNEDASIARYFMRTKKPALKFILQMDLSALFS
jgi:hypothetical protein